MSASLVEFAATIETERWRGESSRDGEADRVLVEVSPVDDGNGQATLFSKRGRIEVWANADPGELDEGLTYVFYGQWKPYYDRRTQTERQQFQAKSFAPRTPHGERGVVRYLRKAPGIGQARAKALWERWRGEAVKLLREQPDVAAAALKIPIDRAEAAAAYLQQRKTVEDCSIRLINLLDGRGFPRDVSKLALRQWGNRAPELIERNPFRLIGFRGCGFALCDDLYTELGHDPGRIIRQAFCLWAVMRKNTDGHTWFSTDFIEREMRRLVSSAVLRPVRALIAAKRLKLVETRRDESGRLWVALRPAARAERVLARRFSRLLDQAGDWPDPDDLDDVTEHQRETLHQALRARIGVFSGRPGTGKTYTVARLVRLLMESVPPSRILCVALSNAAAIRIRDTLASYDVTGIWVATIHSALGVRGVQGGVWQFEHDERNPLPVDYVFIDELSMPGTGTLASLMLALQPQCQVLGIGDLFQLPPVEHGAPLRDLVAAGVPVGELTEPMRNGGRGQEADTTLRERQQFAVSPRVDLAAGENLPLLPARNNEEIASRICRALENLQQQGLADPIAECQVITAVNSGNPCGRIELNAAIQAVVNPHGASVGGCPWRVGDKIVCRDRVDVRLEQQVDDDLAETHESGRGGPEITISKGTFGFVQEFVDDGKRVVVEFLTPRCRVSIPLKSIKDERPQTNDGKRSATASAFALGYATTCHYMQGSEQHIVFVALDTGRGARMVTGLEWLITGISRMQRICYLVGRKSTADSMAMRRKLPHRKTFLRELIDEFRRRQVGGEVHEQRQSIGQHTGELSLVGETDSGSQAGEANHGGNRAAGRGSSRGNAAGVGSEP